MSTWEQEVPIERIGVVVPAHNEQMLLPYCLDALRLAASRITVPVTVVVVLDTCTDDSAAAVDRDPGPVDAVVVDARSVGAARAAGMSEVLRRLGPSGTWLATTDSDSEVPENWFTAQLRYAAARAGVVAGTVAIRDWADRGCAVRNRAQALYKANGHNHIHGANLSFAATAYCAVGGFESVTSDEDVRLVDAFRANGEAIVWATDLPVTTSARRDSRAPHGFAEYLTSLEVGA